MKKKSIVIIIIILYFFFGFIKLFLSVYNSPMNAKMPAETLHSVPKKYLSSYIYSIVWLEKLPISFFSKGNLDFITFKINAAKNYSLEIKTASPNSLHNESYVVFNFNNSKIFKLDIPFNDSQVKSIILQGISVDKINQEGNITVLNVIQIPKFYSITKDLFISKQKKKSILF